MDTRGKTLPNLNVKEKEKTKMDWQAILDQITSWATTAGVKLLVALVVMFVSFKIVNFIGKRIEKAS